MILFCLRYEITDHDWAGIGATSIGTPFDSSATLVSTCSKHSASGFP